MTYRGMLPTAECLLFQDRYGAQHCQTLAAIYAKAADEAGVIARAHQGMTGHS